MAETGFKFKVGEIIGCNSPDYNKDLFEVLETFRGTFCSTMRYYRVAPLGKPSDIPCYFVEDDDLYKYGDPYFPKSYESS